MAKINSRAKGAQAERELCHALSDLLGETLVEPLKRNLEQARNGGHDILGLDGWALEIKRYRTVKEGDLARFWEQAVDQAHRVSMRPVLAYREDFRSWRVRIKLSELWGEGADPGVDWTAELSLPAFAAIVREQHSATQLHDQQNTN